MCMGSWGAGIKSPFIHLPMTSIPAPFQPISIFRYLYLSFSVHFQYHFCSGHTWPSTCFALNHWRLTSGDSVSETPLPSSFYFNLINEEGVKIWGKLKAWRRGRVRLFSVTQGPKHCMFIRLQVFTHTVYLSRIHFFTFHTKQIPTFSRPISVIIWMSLQLGSGGWGDSR